MKKVNSFITFLMYISLGLWGIKALLDYNNYTRHVELFADNGWFWYEDALRWGMYIVPIVVICFFAKIMILKNKKL